MDKTKKPLGIVSMVYEDYDLLERWYNYYGAQVGPENLFVYSHGNDPKHREIAKDASVMNVPRDPQMVKFDRRRWTMLSAFTSGMLQFYNWFLTTDIDELVVVDPDVAPGLVPYLEQTYPDLRTAPPSISPFALNIVHVPEEEPDPIERGKPVLASRRFYAPSRVYSKPILVRQPVMFGPGAHRNNLGPRTLSDDLYLVHLKYFDIDGMTDRAMRQTRLLEQMDSGSNTPAHVWSKTLEDYQKIRANHTLGPEDITLPEIRRKMARRQKQKFTDQYIWGQFANTQLYQIPKRFSQLV